MTSILAFNNDLEYIKLHAQSLPSTSIYLAGIASAKIKEPINEIINLLLQLETDFDLEESEKNNAIEWLWNGDFQGAEKILEDNRVPPLPPFNELSLSEKWQLALEQNQSISEEISIQENKSAKNLHPGEYMEPDQAEAFTEYSNEFIEVLNKEVVPILIDTQNMMCKICLEPMMGWNKPLSCGCFFHDECLKDYFAHEISVTKFPLSWPECHVEVKINELQERLDPAMMEKFEEFSFKFYVQRNMKELSLCPTADCRYVFIWDSETTHFICSLCRKEYCLKCNVPYHKGVDWEEFQKWKDVSYLDQKFFDLKERVAYKQCPECQFWVEKSEGCDHMTCRCGFEFWYICGAVYGQCNCEQEE